MRRTGLTLLLLCLLFAAGIATAEPVAEEPNLLETVIEILLDFLPESATEEEPPPTPEIMGGVDPTG